MDLARGNGDGFPADGSSSLSNLHIEVLKLIADGADLATVSKRLHMSEATVTRALRSIRNELGANSTIQAVLFAARQGLL